MNITLSGTKVSMDGHTLAFQKNNLVDSMVITVDTDETWQYKLDVKYPCKDSNGKELYNVIDLTRVGNTCTAILQATMLPFNGKYTMQLRGVSGDKVYHTDTFDVWVKYSIDPSKVYDPVPSEFYQIEQAVTEQAANAKQSATESAESAKQSAESATNAAASATKAENAAVHSPIVGENGNWFIWDFEKSEYVDSGKSASGTPPITPDTAGKYLTNDGSKAEWGVMSGGSDLSLGIAGATVGQIVKIIEVDSSGKPTKWQAVNDRLPEVTPSDNGRVLSVEQIGEFEYGYGFTDMPNINTFIPLGITGASPGQFAKVKYVDDFGQPTEWEAVDMASGEEWEKIADIELRADTALYVLADFAVWRKAKVIMRRPKYVSGLNKNVWCRVETKNDASVAPYICGYLGSEYGYAYWDFSAEVSSNVISSAMLRNNNLNKAEAVMSTQTLTPIDLPPTDYVFTLTFTDTSVIQDGDKVTVIGVRR